MAKIMIEKLTTNSSKQDEIVFLRKVREAAGTDTYLSQLLSENLVAWAEDKIESDFSLDLLDDFRTESSRSHREGERVLTIQREYHELEDRAAQLKTDLDHAIEQVTIERNMRQSAIESAANFQQQIVAMTGELHDIHARETMHIEAHKMHTAEKRALLDAIQKVVFDEDGSETARELLRMIVIRKGA